MGQVIGSAYFMTASGETTGLEQQKTKPQSQDSSETAKQKLSTDSDANSNSEPGSDRSSDQESKSSSDRSTDRLRYTSLIASKDGTGKKAKKDASEAPVPAIEEESDIDRALRLAARDRKDQDQAEPAGEAVSLYSANPESEPEPGSSVDGDKLSSRSQDADPDPITSQVPGPQVLGKMDRSRTSEEAKNASDQEQLDAELLNTRKMDTSANKFLATSSLEVRRFVNLPVTGEEGTLTFVLIAVLGLVFVLTASVVLKH